MPAIASLGPSPPPLACPTSSSTKGWKVQRRKVTSVRFLEHGRPGPAATPARNIRLSGCTYEVFSQFREDLRLNLLKVGRVKLSCNQVAGAEMADTWDEEEDNESSLMLDWATDERIAATDPVVAQLIADIDAEFAGEVLPVNPPRSASLAWGESYSTPSTN
jgi:hypothetical protein